VTHHKFSRAAERAGAAGSRAILAVEPQVSRSLERLNMDACLTHSKVRPPAPVLMSTMK